ncbi:hypothetical protein B005_2530 [Nocardiopsis alba ATCC BAA-2165]|uniref:Uncharacterized protein n=1 Tax=Nocardiopsis alba (strain ATCC BAA-2165 / BE74) TaxID=1205910 RepID=J7LHQ2_NOCAA|nr:hypothetical protein B005_2530 [Nocardiopsis alba ATCC BAA-2165]
MRDTHAPGQPRDGDDPGQEQQTGVGTTGVASSEAVERPPPTREHHGCPFPRHCHRTVPYGRSARGRASIPREIPKHPRTESNRSITLSYLRWKNEPC